MVDFPTVYGLRLTAGLPCTKCVCLYCYNTDCPHIKRQEKRCKDWITSRCHFCNMSFGTEKKPLDGCDFFVPAQIPRREYYTVVRRYRKKTQMQTLLERLDRIEKLLENLTKP